MNKITVAKALKELKTLNSRILRAHSEGVYIGIMRGGKDVHRKYETETDMVKAIQSSFDHITQLRENRAKLKAAIIQSNATTMVELPLVGKVSLAQAIEYKELVNERKAFINTLKVQFQQVDTLASRYEQENNQVIEQRIQAVSVGDKKPDEAVVKSVRDAIEDQLGFKVVDTKNIREYIQKELDNIEAFEHNVDDIINTSNVMTLIDV